MNLPLGRPLLLDSGPLGQIARRRRPPEIDAWFRGALAAGAQFVLPEITDYEMRRNYLLEDLKHSLARLDGLKATMTYLPLTTEVMQQAARLWAQARKQGHPTGDPRELDGDVILAAQALSVNGIVVTDNVGHLSLFVDAYAWQGVTV